MSFRGFTFRLAPTPEQTAGMERFAGVCRLVWNLALEQRINHWRQYQRTTGNNLNGVTQCRELTALRAEFDWIRAVPQRSQQIAIANLDAAFKRFFAGKGGFPVFKRKSRNDSFGFVGREVAVEPINRRWGRIRLPKLGWVKFRRTREIEGAVREVTVTRTALGWQASLGCLIDRDLPEVLGAIGIDRGVTVPLMLSDGTSYVLPPSLADVETKRRRAQKVASRRKRGSVRHAKAQRRVAALSAKAARTRKHWAHQSTTDIARRFGTVVIERLRTQNMTKRARLVGVAQKRGLNRAILNVGWNRIETMLAYKAARLIKVDPAYTSQSCASCGTVDSRSRENQASFVCTACGHRDNADRNAAINILNRGNIPGVEGAGCGPVEARSIHGVDPVEIAVLLDGVHVKGCSRRAATGH